MVKRIATRINAISPRGDMSELRGFLAEFFATDFVLTLVDGPPDQPGVFRGHEAALGYSQTPSPMSTERSRSW